MFLPFSLNQDHLQSVLDRIFKLFDEDGNGMITFNELSAGLTVLCGGSREDKVETVFHLFDDNGGMNFSFISLYFSCKEDREYTSDYYY